MKWPLFVIGFDGADANLLQTIQYLSRRVAPSNFQFVGDESWVFSGDTCELGRVKH